MTADRIPHPTPIPAINLLLDRLLTLVSRQLADQFVGLYLHGSLALGGFNPHRSDIDFLVVTSNALSPEDIHDIKQMHSHLTATGLEWVTKLEGSYIPQVALRRYQPGDTIHPALRSDGSFDLDHHASDWIIQRHIIREHGIVLAGPSPQALIDPVPPAALRQAQSGILRQWWMPQLSDTTLLQSSEYQAYAILTMCRALYTFQLGQVCSKLVAARWTQENHGERWSPLIELALARQHGGPLQYLHEVLEFIRYTLQLLAP